MIALTGGGGFIGSVILGYLNRQGITDICVFDDLPKESQFQNLIGKKFIGLYSTKEFIGNLENFDAVVHFGADSSTLERDWEKIYRSNVASTRKWHDLCRDHKKKFIFASSAAVYGSGDGPLNHYAFSKYVSEQEITDGVILRLFNVYGPNESHKGRMASTIFHWYNQIKKQGYLEIFENSDNFKRDFIWAEDVAAAVCHFIYNYQPGIYDLGTGQSHSFEYLADTLIKNVGGEKKYIQMPDDLSSQYQTDTKADTSFLSKSGLDLKDFCTIEKGIEIYSQYLKGNFRY